MSFRQCSVLRILRKKMTKESQLKHRHSDLFARFKFSLDGLVHSLSNAARDPDFIALRAGLYGNILKKIKMPRDKAVNSDFLRVELPSTNSTQGIFHYIFSLRVFGSSHLLGSSQWTVTI